MLSTLVDFVATVATFYGLFVLAGWLAVWRTLRPDDPRGYVEAADWILPARLEAAREALVARGFDEVIRAAHGTSPLSTAFAILHLRSAGHGVMLARVGPTAYVEFFSEYGDASITTNDSPTLLGVYATPPNRHCYQLPWLDDVVELERVHRLLCAKHVPGGTPTLATPEDVLVLLRRFMEREIAYQVARGLLRQTADGVRPTVLGALRFTALSVTPVLQMRRAWRGWRTARLVRQLELGSAAATASR